MRTKSKIWLGVGAFAVVGTGTVSVVGALIGTAPGASALATPASDTAIGRIEANRIVVAQPAGHDQPDPNKEAGEGNEGQNLANLPPELAFAVRIALLRGHLLVGDELVRQQQWNAALPHFLHPGEELYGDLKDQLANYNVPPFDTALKTL